MNNLLIRSLLLMIAISTLGAQAYGAVDKRCQKVAKLTAKTSLKTRSGIKPRFLNAHNKIRQIYDLPNLKWSQKLADHAQQWAQYLKNHNKCQLKHRTQGKYGENLAMNWTSRALPKTQFDKSPEFAVLGWAKECKDYSHSGNKCAAGKVCGHFTQVAWEDSEKVGCGMVTCDGAENVYGTGRVELWVCNYDPPGNYVGKRPF